MSTLTFIQALDLAESQARSTLDVALHERLSCAVSLVRDGRVFQTSGGAWEVDSASREGLVHSVNGVCSCEDAHFQAPQGLCKHRLSVYLARRAQQLLAQPPTPPPVEPPVEPWPDNDVEPAEELGGGVPLLPQKCLSALARGSGQRQLPHHRGRASGATHLTRQR